MSKIRGRLEGTRAVKSDTIIATVYYPMCRPSVWEVLPTSPFYSWGCWGPGGGVMGSNSLARVLFEGCEHLQGSCGNGAGSPVTLLPRFPPRCGTSRALVIDPSPSNISNGSLLFLLNWWLKVFPTASFLFNKRQRLQFTMTFIQVSALNSSRSSVSFLGHHTLFQIFFHFRKRKQMSSSLDISGGKESHSWCSLQSQEPFLIDYKLLIILFLWHYCANVYPIMYS